MSAPMFYRIVVLDVVYDPFAVTSDRLEYWRNEFSLHHNTIDATVLPRNTIIAKGIVDVNYNDSEVASFFFPFFPPHLSLPCKPGEHMWAFYNEGPNSGKQGYWFCRIADLWHVDDLNHTHHPRGYDSSFSFSKSEPNKRQYFEFNNYIPDKNRNPIPGTSFVGGGPDFYSGLIDKGPEQFNVSSLLADASVPRYKKRPGDLCFEGSNNTLIVLGTDRNGPVADHVSKEYTTSNKNLLLNVPYIPLYDSLYGSIDMVAGRGRSMDTKGESVLSNVYPKIDGYPDKNVLPKIELNKTPHVAIQYPNEGDPDLLNDASRIRISEKNKVDFSLDIGTFNSSNFSISDSTDGDGSIIIKADKVRLVARRDVEILVSENHFNTGSYAAIVIKTNGDIVFRPSEMGFVKLGGDDANKALICTDYDVTDKSVNGKVVAIGPNGVTMLNNDGASFGSGAPNQGMAATKILVK